MIKKNKKYFYTCCAIINGSLCGETYFVVDRDQAYSEYYGKYNTYPSFIDGPFYRKLEKNKKVVDRKEVKLTNKMVSGLYKGNKVKGLLLASPENYVLLIFGTSDKNNIVHISELKDLK